MHYLFDLKALKQCPVFEGERAVVTCEDKVPRIRYHSNGHLIHKNRLIPMDEIPSAAKCRFSQFGGVQGYDPLEHRLLIHQMSEIYEHKFITILEPRYIEEGEVRRLEFEIQLTPVGKEAIRLAPLNAVFWSLGNVVVKPSLALLDRIIREPLMGKAYADYILATDDDWLQPARDAVMEEIMKRDAIADMYVLPNREGYCG